MDKVIEQLGPTLLCHRDGSIVAAPTAELLKGVKFLAFYFSASWCGPCRAFTPAFACSYQSQSTEGGREVEVVFVSADRDERSFNAYYAHHPWLSLPYDSDARSVLPSTFSVWGIPKVAVIDLSDGHLVKGDAAGIISASPSLAGLFRSDMRDDGSWGCEVQ